MDSDFQFAEASSQESDGLVPRILVVEDQPAMRKLLDEYFGKRNFEVTCCESADEVLRKFGSGNFSAIGKSTNRNLEGLSSLARHFDAVLTDVRMPGTDGLSFCDLLHQQVPELPVIVMTAYGSMDTAVEALRAGAFDFVTKPIEMELLLASLSRATKFRLMRRRVYQLSRQIKDQSFANLIGESEPIRKLKQQLVQFAESDASVLLTGESGVGKEVVARTLHSKSSRSRNPFVALNCAALSESLVESELFGHVKGAFTDAKSEREGLFVEADGGTLFLDEIGEMPIEIQPKLLRALEERIVRPVGGSKATERPFDVRLITATNRDLEEEIRAQRFREDLFYRINVLELHIPPLRARNADVVLIASSFLKEFAAQQEREAPELSTAAIQKILTYNWPGNVRELRNVIQRAMVLAQPGQPITPTELPEKIVNFDSGKLVLGDRNYQPLASLTDIESQYIQYVLDQTDGNRGEAARILGIDRKTLYRKLKADSA